MNNTDLLAAVELGPDPLKLLRVRDRLVSSCPQT